MNDIIIDNQQVTSERKAWLAGIFDGEGSLLVSTVKRKNNKYNYSVHAAVVNTEEFMVAEIIEILEKCDISFHIWKEDTRKKKHKACYHITIRNMQNILKLLDVLDPYLISKKPQAILLRRYVKSRILYKRKVNRDDKEGRILGMQEQGYSKEELACVNQLKLLNKTGKDDGTSETIRKTLQKK